MKCFKTFFSLSLGMSQNIFANLDLLMQCFILLRESQWKNGRKGARNLEVDYKSLYFFKNIILKHEIREIVKFLKFT